MKKSISNLSQTKNDILQKKKLFILEIKAKAKKRATKCNKYRAIKNTKESAPFF